jgi:uncharacterized protein YdcH (DUF465 family)
MQMQETEPHYLPRAIAETVEEARAIRAQAQSQALQMRKARLALRDELAQAWTVVLQTRQRLREIDDRLRPRV